MLTAEQLRAARAMLRMDQKTLADASGVSVPTIKRLEASSGILRAQFANVEALRAALESNGITFSPQPGEGPAVGLRHR